VCCTLADWLVDRMSVDEMSFAETEFCHIENI
jgi:hypothetical protein